MDGIKDEGEDGSNSSPRPPGAADDVTRSASDEYGIMARPAPSAPAVAVAVAGAVAAGAENRTDDDDGNATTTIAEALQMVETLTCLFGFDFDVAHDAVNAVGAKDVTLCCDYILDHGLGRDVGGAVAPIDDCPHLLSLGLSVSASAATDNLPLDVMSRPCCYYQLREGAGKGRQQRSSGGGMGGVGRPKDDVDATTGICPMGENWMCLTCGDVYCSRYVNGHGIQHWQDSCIIKGGGEEKECQRNDDDDDDDRGSRGCSNNNNNNDEHGHCVMVSLADLSVWCHRCAAYLRHESLKPILRRLEEIKFKDDNDDGGIYDDEQLRAQKKV